MVDESIPLLARIIAVDDALVAGAGQPALPARDWLLRERLGGESLLSPGSTTPCSAWILDLWRSGRGRGAVDPAFPSPDTDSGLPGDTAVGEADIAMVWLWGALVTAVLAVLGLAGWRWGCAVSEVSRGLDMLGKGKRTRQILIHVWGPMGRLIRVFNTATPEIQARIDQLEEDRQQLRVVLGAMAEAVIAIDPRRRLIFANTSADALFGLDASSVGRLVPELIRSPHVQNAVEETLRLFHPDAYQGELAFPLRESALRGRSRILSVRGTPLPGYPPSGAVLVFHDVTNLRRLERMRQDFVANASHELKTPLAAIKAYAETLIDWALHDETVNRRFLERIDDQADRLNHLIMDMLSLARLDSGQEFFEHGPLGLVPVLEACIEGHRGRAEAKNLSLVFDPGSLDGETLVVADEEAIRQIFDNLIDNAIKYTPEGGKVRVTCSQGEGAVNVDVTDSGIGIPRDELPRIFERFYRVDKARSRELGGTGLGLSIVKHLITSIHGQISVTSRPGSGSRFTVKIPRSQSVDALDHETQRLASSEPEAALP
jgi:two-component system phosphate regulon sensor histidine kinase PhoR